jgi:hypothetical protein
MDDRFLTELQASAVQIHELYHSFIEAGFAPDQAFELTRTLLGAANG